MRQKPKNYVDIADKRINEKCPNPVGTKEENQS